MPLKISDQTFSNRENSHGISLNASVCH